MVESHKKKKEKTLSGQDKLLVGKWQKRMARKEKDRRAQQDWEEAWTAYIADKSKKQLQVMTRTKTKTTILQKMQAMRAAQTRPTNQARRI